MESKMIKSTPWLSWDQLFEQVKDKRIIYFGAGEWAVKMQVYLPKSAGCIVDNNSNACTEEDLDLGIPVYNPQRLRSESPNEIIIITSAFLEVSEQLNGYGLKSGINYVVSPSLK